MVSVDVKHHVYLLFHVQVTKNRFDGELGVMLLKFDKESLSFAVKERQVKRPVKEEMDAEENPGLHPPVEGLEYPIEEHWSWGLEARTRKQLHRQSALMGENSKNVIPKQSALWGEL